MGAVTSGAYCASKARVVGLTRCVALEDVPHGVTCNAISPTWVHTGFGRDWMRGIAAEQEQRWREAYVADIKEANPQGRPIDPAGTGLPMKDFTVSAGSLW